MSTFDSRKASFSRSEVEASIVVHEWLIEHRHAADNAPVSPLCQLIDSVFDSYGSSAVRTIAMQAALIVEACWDYCEAIDPDYGDDQMWDWDFVPWICRNLDWETLASDNQYKKGDWSPDIELFMETLNAAKALEVVT